MTKRFFFPIFLLLPFAFCVGCSHLDVTPEGDPDRVVEGTVNVRPPDTIPIGASVIVRLVDNALIGGTAMVLGEQTVTAAAGGSAVPFRVEFRAEDAVLRQGVDLEVRVSVDGKLRYVNASAIKFQLNQLGEPQEVWLAASK